ncbi:Tam3-transposase (Ac family) [Handroanthus impetiginosus]|uniref:Tam3-transposase (Ac family) n=1 Tax=Handroanthus impetiginosus TaxID=429701 RepID=A0A2G9G5D0_9LAMI|nr:Tam3-transposase (Ac family) [Handroanthus impetiginosus]
MSIDKFFARIPKFQSANSSSQNSPLFRENVNHPENPPNNDEQSQEVDVNSLKADPAKRLAILKYHPNHRDTVRRAYIQKGPCQPRNHNFPQTEMSGALRRFNFKWFNNYPDWLEYSVSSDAAFCLPCYLFKDEDVHQRGGDVFSSRGFRSWNKKDRFGIHVGGPNSDHYKAKKKCEDLMRQSQSIQVALDKQSSQAKMEYRIRLIASIKVVRFLLGQGMAFRGHDEGISSSNRGNFLELLRYHTEICDEDVATVLRKAPKNNQLTSPAVQKEIIRACAIETAKVIIKDLNGDYFSVLVDESRDVSCKEQMALVLRYVDRRGFVMERFIGILHVRDTSASSLKESIASLLAQHSLSMSYIRGQCYDGASNMQGQFNGLKALIQRENRSAHSVHCFSHQLQLTLVGISKKCDEVAGVVNLVSAVLNVVGASFKRRDELRDAQILKVQKALEVGDLQTGRGQNQELGLARPSDTRWGSHFKSFVNFILLFDSIIDVLDIVGTDAESSDERWKARGFLDACLKFEFVFMLHFMKNILSITNELNAALQRKEQDIVNAMLLVGVAKKRLQTTRDTGWDSLIDDVLAFCIKHDIEIPRFDSFYVFRGKSRRKVAEYTVLHHYRVEVFYKVIDWQLQELNSRFNEVTSDLLHGMVCLSPSQSFANFDIEKIMRLATLYPDDFTEYDLVELRCQLENYIVDVGSEDIRFSSLNGIGDLSKKLVETKKHLVYSHVYRLIRFSLLLPVATASVERAFSAMKFIKTDLRNRMEDGFLNDCLITFKERDVFVCISDDDIMTTFQNMKTRRGQLD